MLQIGILELCIAGAVCVGVATSTFFWTRGHYIDQFDTLKAQLTQAAKDEQKQIDEEIKNNTTVTKEVNDEAVNQIGNMSNAITDLLLQHNAVSTSKVPATTNTTTCIDDTAIRPATTAGVGQDQSVAQSVIDTKELVDVLQLTKDSITAQMLWREWAKGVK